MKESKFIGTFMPTHPDFQPITQAIKENTNSPKLIQTGSQKRRLSPAPNRDLLGKSGGVGRGAKPRHAAKRQSE
jgi:hypothetical protein